MCLAFDRSIVSAAFASGNEKLDVEFLEKIIQVSLKLPIPWREELRGLFFAKINALIGDATPADETRWRNMFGDVVDPYLDTPRDVIRLVNTLQVIWPNVQGDVDLTDLVGLTTLQLFDPAAYDLIAENIETITYADYRYENDEAFGKRLEPSVAKRPEVAKEAMALMFPRLAKAWNTFTYEGEHLATREQRRICTSAYYRHYFQFARSPRRLSKMEVDALLAAADPDDALDVVLSRLIAAEDGRSPPKVALLLEQIFETTQQRPLLTPGFVRALLKQGDRLIVRKDTTRELFTRDNFDRLVTIVKYGLTPLDPADREKILHVLVNEPACIAIRSDVLEDCARQHGLYGGKQVHESETLFPKELIESAAKTIITQIADVCASGAVFELPLPIRMIWRWRRMTNKKKLRPWFQRVLKNREWTLKLASDLPRTSYRSGPNGSEVIWTFKRSDFSDCFNVDALIARVEKLAAEDLEAAAVMKRLRETENA